MLNRTYFAIIRILLVPVLVLRRRLCAIERVDVVQRVAVVRPWDIAVAAEAVCGRRLFFQIILGANGTFAETWNDLFPVYT